MSQSAQCHMPTQSCSHLIISFSAPDTANRAILNRLIICSKRVTVQKCKREPLHCLKCHSWNHVTAECGKPTDVCRTCGSNNHQIGNCNNMNTKKCMSCNSNNHTSWDQNCPTFLQRCKEQNACNPENNMPFFPSMEVWSWASSPPTQVMPALQAPSFLNQVTHPPHTQWLQQTQLPYAQAQPNKKKYGYRYTGEAREDNDWLSIPPQENGRLVWWKEPDNSNNHNRPRTTGANSVPINCEHTRQSPPHSQSQLEGRQ
jgi:hypothetical protein